MKRHIILGFCCLMAAVVFGQAPTQKGRVKTIGRPGKPGVPLANVTVRMRGVLNSVVSNADGTFSIAMAGKKDGDAIYVMSVSKIGYELKDKGLVGRAQVFSQRVPLEIVMVNREQLEADRKRIEDNAYRVAKENYNKKIEEIKKRLKDNEITNEMYSKELHDLDEKLQKYQSLIGDMADRYARTDYDQLDSIDVEINVCIENGDLDKADSLIHTVFDPETVLERNRAAKAEIQQRIEFAQRVIDKAAADREAILRDMQYAERVLLLNDKLVGAYLARGEREKVLDCLEKALKIQTILYGEDDERVAKTRERIISIKQNGQSDEQ